MFPAASSSATPSSSTMNMARQPPVNPLSLIPSSYHSQSVLQLVDMKIDRRVIDYVVDTVSETVDYALGRPPPASPLQRGRTSSKRRSSHLLKFTSFVTTVLSRAEVTMPTLLVTCVYVNRAKPHLHIALEEWALERVFLGALIVASKYLNDSTLKNVHWALCTGVFGKRDVGRIEREFLDVLDWELSIREAEVDALYEGLMSAVDIKIPSSIQKVKAAPSASRPTLPYSPNSSKDLRLDLPLPMSKSPRHSVHQRHPRSVRNHHRSHRSTSSITSDSSSLGVPELSPHVSSSSSSSSSSSPLSWDSDAESPSPSPPRTPADVPMSVDLVEQSKPKGSALNDLLRLFPNVTASQNPDLLYSSVPRVRV